MAEIKQVSIDLGELGELNVTYDSSLVTDDDLARLMLAESFEPMIALLIKVIVGWDFYAERESLDPLPISSESLGKLELPVIACLVSDVIQGSVHAK